MEGDIPTNKFSCRDYISIHSLRMEGDFWDWFQFENDFHFNPLPPYGGRPPFYGFILPPGHISIHSLRMEGDVVPAAVLMRSVLYFNPLPPYGGRLPRRRTPTAYHLHFNPLPPYGGRPLLSTTIFPHNLFQSTPSVWRETGMCPWMSLWGIYFNPLPPYGGRRTSQGS